MKLSVQKNVLPLSFSCLVTWSLTYLRGNSCNVQRNKVVGQRTLFIVFLHAYLHCLQGFFVILRELYRAIWAPFPDFGGRHCQGRVILLDLPSFSIWWQNLVCLMACWLITWPHGAAVFVQAGHSVNSIHIHNCFALSIDLSVEKAIKILNKHH